MTIGTLYIVATPIGNMEDITVRSAKLLTEMGVIACEDTRKTGLLLDHLRKTYLAQPLLAKKPRLLSYYDQNEEGRATEIISLLKQGQDVALVSDAGTPTISDPGFRIVKACRDEGIPVVGLPGPSSAILALSVSGLPTDKFLFLGYLPHKESHATDLLERTKKSQKLVSSTVIIFEAPHKILKTLERIQSVYGDIELTICRELTKVYEEVVRSKTSELLQKYTAQEARGEFVILWHM